VRQKYAIFIALTEARTTYRMIYLLPFLAVMISFGIMMFASWLRPRSFRLLLAFSGAFLLSLTVFELLPDVYEDQLGKEIGLFILLGIVLQIVLEFMSKGAEHGHLHFDSQGIFPAAVLLSLSLHAFLEGIPIQENKQILYGIVVHKIPIALLLSAFLLQTGSVRLHAFLFMLIFAVMTPLGTYITQEFSILQSITPYLKAIVIGMFLHISTVILFESSEGHTFNFRKIMAILLGLGLAYFM